MKLTAQVSVRGLTLVAEWETDAELTQNAFLINQAAGQLADALELPECRRAMGVIDGLAEGARSFEIETTTLRSGITQDGRGVWFFVKNKSSDGIRLPPDLAPDYCRAAGIPLPQGESKSDHAAVRVRVERRGNKDVVTEILNREHTA